ncbi:MAG: DUF4097 family beta strand repeat protein [Oscillospiraceae bacterium]|nr:DUF4097 family beta strand repeat protein [Oscillospiraceae bacterium]
MNKKEFIDELCKRLRKTPADEAERTVNYYSEAIDDRIEDGMTEEEAVAALGSIDDIVREVIGQSAADEKGETADNRETEIKRVRKNYVVDPAGVNTVNVTETNGSVELAKSPDGRIHFRVTEDKNLSYSVRKEKGVVIIRKETRRIGFAALGISFPIDFGMTESRIKVELPDNFAPFIDVKTGSGDISGTVGAAQGLFAGTGSGDISLKGVASGKTTLTSASGDVEVLDLMTNEAEISTVSGDLSMKRCAAESMKLKTVSGGISGKEIYADKKLIVNTVSGDIDINMESPLELGSFESTSGDISLSLYGCESDYSVSAKSITGKVGAPNGNESAGRAIRVRTASGDIDVFCEV